MLLSLLFHFGVSSVIFNALFTTSAGKRECPVLNRHDLAVCVHGKMFDLGIFPLFCFIFCVCFFVIQSMCGRPGLNLCVILCFRCQCESLLDSIVYLFMFSV